MASCGTLKRRTGLVVRFPAQAIADLSSPNVVSAALHLMR